MTETFEQILNSLLKQYEENPEQDIDALIAEKCKELGLDEKAMQFVQETNSYIDAFTEKSAELNDMKAQRQSRKRWLLREMEQITTDRSDEEKAQIAEAVEQAGQTWIDNTLEGKE